MTIQCYVCSCPTERFVESGGGAYVCEDCVRAKKVPFTEVPKKPCRRIIARSDARRLASR